MNEKSKKIKIKSHNIQMKNCSTKNFTNKMETCLDFNQKYKSLIERERLLVSLIERDIY
jgi:hypothetical protein